MVGDATWFTETPAGFRARDVVVRLARPDERRRWDDLVARHHHLGFKQFAGRGLRHVFEWRGMWLGAAGWQTGVFKCGPRDRWVRWPEGRQFERLHLIGNNTRFVLFGAAGVFPHLASHALSRMTRRPGDDWRERWEHGLLVAESFVDPRRFGGAMYRAAGWRLVGRSRGHSRSNGRYVREPGSGPKDLYVRPLGRGALRLLRRDGELGEGWRAKVGGTGVSSDALEGMVESLAGVADLRRAQGRRHSARVLLAVLLLSKLAGNDGPVAAAQYARGLSQRELAALGAWRNPRTGRMEPPSKSTLHLFQQSLDPEGLEEALRRWAVPRLQVARALAGDGKRLRGANRNGGGEHWETVTMVEHGSAMPCAVVTCRDDGGEAAAMRAALEAVPVEGCVVTLDALHTNRSLARPVVETHRADWMMTVKDNAPDTLEGFERADWDRGVAGRWSETAELGHGRIERRSIEVLDPSRYTVNHPHARQMFRVTREREVLGAGGGGPTVTRAYGMASDADASPRELLEPDRGHWIVEAIHNIRDKTFREDACLARTGHGPANNAIPDMCVVALVKYSMAQGRNPRPPHRGGAPRRPPDLPEVRRHLAGNRRDALRMVTGAMHA